MTTAPLTDAPPCTTCSEPLELVVETHTHYWQSLTDGDTLSYTPHLHDHGPADHLRDAAERGIGAASWVDVDPSDADSLTTDVDPEVMDRYQPPSPLSGEWAGESMTEMGLADLTDAYEDVYCTAYWQCIDLAAAAIVRAETGADA